jgi:hypothetical protein
MISDLIAQNAAATGGRAGIIARIAIELNLLVFQMASI